TVQVFTTHKSACSPSFASRNRARNRPSRTSSVSYWFTLQPRVSVLSVADIEELFRRRLKRRAHRALTAIDVLVGAIGVDLVAFQLGVLERGRQTNSLPLGIDLF